MNATEKARRSDALYYSANDGINRRWLCDKVASLEAENVKLRKLAREACEMARAFYNLGGTFNDLDDLLCEAAELGIEVDG